MDDPMTPPASSKIAASLTETLTRISADLEAEQTLKEVRESPFLPSRASLTMVFQTVDQGVSAAAGYAVPFRNSSDQPSSFHAIRSVLVVRSPFSPWYRSLIHAVTQWRLLLNRHWTR